jgi:hypothetical protein
LDAVAEFELLQDVGDVALEGGFAEVELAGDLCVREAAGEQAEDLDLTLAVNRLLSPKGALAKEGLACRCGVAAIRSRPTPWRAPPQCR